MCCYFSTFTLDPASKQHSLPSFSISITRTSFGGFWFLTLATSEPNSCWQISYLRINCLNIFLNHSHHASSFVSSIFCFFGAYLPHGCAVFLPGMPSQPKLSRHHPHHLRPWGQRSGARIGGVHGPPDTRRGGPAATGATERESRPGEGTSPPQASF